MKKTKKEQPSNEDLEARGWSVYKLGCWLCGLSEEMEEVLGRLEIIEMSLDTERMLQGVARLKKQGLRSPQIEKQVIRQGGKLKKKLKREARKE